MSIRFAFRNKDMSPTITTCQEHCLLMNFSDVLNKFGDGFFITRPVYARINLMGT